MRDKASEMTKVDASIDAGSGRHRPGEGSAEHRRRGAVGEDRRGGCRTGEALEREHLGLFQAVMEFLMTGHPPRTDHPLLETSYEADRLRFLSAISGLPCVREVPPVAAAERGPTLIFNPSAGNLEALYLAHRSLRAMPQPLSGSDRAALAVLGAIGSELRRHGLLVAYVAAARRVRRTTSFTDGTTSE